MLPFYVCVMKCFDLSRSVIKDKSTLCIGWISHKKYNNNIINRVIFLNRALIIFWPGIFREVQRIFSEVICITPSYWILYLNISYSFLFFPLFVKTIYYTSNNHSNFRLNKQLLLILPEIWPMITNRFVGKLNSPLSSYFLLINTIL